VRAKVAVGIVSMLCAGLAERYGLARAHCLALAGVDERTLRDPEGLVEMTALVAVLRYALERTGDPGVGLALARTWDLRQHGFWGYALLSSNSGRERLDGHVRYSSLRSPVQLTLTEAAGCVTLDMSPHGLPDDVLAPFLDWSIGTSLLHLAQQLGKKPLLQLSLSYPEQPHHKALRELFDGELRFNAPCLRMRLPASLLEQRLQGDAYLGQLVRRQLDAQLEAAVPASEPAEFVDRVRERIAVCLDQDASLNRVARDLGVSSRTLQRHLDAKATSFHTLVEEVRCAYALSAMRETRQSVGRLALSLGYADAASFRRAFRRWTGQSPAGYRAALLTRDAPRNVSGARGDYRDRR
jgi:AraC-like DNA-binding protein